MTTLPDEKRAHWDAVYTTRRPDEFSWYQAHPGTSLEFIGRAGKGTKARIVDVGGGASHLVDSLLDHGFRQVTVLDISPEALARARARLGELAKHVTWIAADVTRWTPQGVFDIWHDRAVFHFLVAAEDRRAYRGALATALPSGGQAIIGT